MVERAPATGLLAMKSMSSTELQAAVNSLVWYHAISLPNGVTTPGWAPQHPEFYKLPSDLAGKRVLDVGTYDGFWCFESLKRGASEVVAIDDFSDTIHAGEQRGWQQFDLCRDALGYTQDQCLRLEMSVYDVSPIDLGQFDVVLFFGTLYHCKHPLLALEKLAAVTKELLCVESAILDDYSPYRAKGFGSDMVMEFYPDDQYGLNHTNWWVPTLHCLAMMVRSVGFKNILSWKIADPTPPVECRGYVQGRL